MAAAPIESDVQVLDKVNGRSGHTAAAVVAASLRLMRRLRGCFGIILFAYLIYFLVYRSDLSIYLPTHLSI